MKKVELQETLTEVIRGVKEEKMNMTAARIITKATDSYLKSIALELEYNKVVGKHKDIEFFED